MESLDSTGRVEGGEDFRHGWREKRVNSEGGRCSQREEGA